MTQVILPLYTTTTPLPLYATSVQAGFPSPAEDTVEKRLDLNEHLIKHPAATFYVRVSGDSMTGAGIHDGDLLIVDRSITAVPKHIVIAIVNGEFTVKRLVKNAQNLALIAENPDYPPILLHPGDEAQIWGVVMHVIHSLT